MEYMFKITTHNKLTYYKMIITQGNDDLNIYYKRPGTLTWNSEVYFIRGFHPYSSKSQYHGRKLTCCGRR